MVDSVVHAPKLSAYSFRVGTKRIGSDDMLWEVVKTKQNHIKKWVKIPSVNLATYNRRSCLRNLVIYKKTTGKGPKYLIGKVKNGKFWEWTTNCPDEYRMYQRRRYLLWSVNKTSSQLHQDQ